MVNKKNKAIFLDRDGVINKEIDDYITSVDLFELNKGLIPFLQKRHEEGYLFIVITNQGAIEKGKLTTSELHHIHEKMTRELLAEGIELAAIYYCPHHSDLSNCLCRKPKSLMIEKSLARFDIDATASYIIGDKPRDVACGEAAGVKGIYIPSNQVTDLLKMTW